MQETTVGFLGWEDSLENPHGQKRSLDSYSPWGHKEFHMTEGLSTNLASVLSFILFCFSNPLVPFPRQIYSLYYFSVPIPMLVSQVAQFSSVQSVSHVQLFATPWTSAHQVSLYITNSQSLLKLMPIESVMPSNHLILCHPLLLLPSIFPSIRVLSSQSILCIRWSKYWSFSFCISPYNEYCRLISFRIDWFDLLAVQGTLKSLL